MLRTTGSGLEIGLPGRIVAGLLPGKHRNRPSGRPISCVPGSSPATIQPGRPISDPEALLRKIEYPLKLLKPDCFFFSPINLIEKPISL